MVLAKQTKEEKEEEKVVPQTCRLKLQPMPLPKFSGDIREYPRFKDDFKAQVVPSISSSQQSYVLKSCLSGTPLDIVKNVDHSIIEMWKRLDDKYGEPSKIIDVVMYEIKKMKQVKEGDNNKFMQMVETVERAYRDLARLHLHEQVSNASTVSMIEEILPLSIRMKWSEEVNSRKRLKSTSFLCYLNSFSRQKALLSMPYQICVQKQVRLAVSTWLIQIKIKMVELPTPVIGNPLHLHV